MCEKLISFTCMENLYVSNVDKFVEDICSNMVETTSELQHHKPRPKSKKRKPWTEEIAQAVKTEKIAIKSGEMKVVLDAKTMNLLIKLKEYKKKLRSVQRRNEAITRQENFRQIMELRETDDKKFYKLVRQQRENNSIAITVLKYNESDLNLLRQSLKHEPTTSRNLRHQMTILTLIVILNRLL